jgi:SET domain
MHVRLHAVGETQKWLVRGQICVAIVACKDIAAGSEILYNYNLEWNGGKRIK